MSPPKNKRKTPQRCIPYAPTLRAYPDKHDTWMHKQLIAVQGQGQNYGEVFFR